MKTCIAMIAIAAGILGLATSSRAASVAWNAPQTISGDADVSTTGILDRAYNFGFTGFVTGATVNGVPFAAFGSDDTQTSITVGNTTVASNTSGTVGAAEVFGSGNTPYASLSSNYQSILHDAIYLHQIPANGTITMTLNGLVSGEQYLFETWVNDSRNALNGGDRTETVTGGTGTTTLAFNNLQADGGVGQYVVGTFTANSTSQIITYTGATGPSSGVVPQINAVELRVLSEPAPLPSAWVAGVALLTSFAGFKWLRLRRQVVN